MSSSIELPTARPRSTRVTPVVPKRVWAAVSGTKTSLPSASGSGPSPSTMPTIRYVLRPAEALPLSEIESPSRKFSWSAKVCVIRADCRSPAVSNPPAANGMSCSLGSRTGSMPSTVTGAGRLRGEVWPTRAARYVLRSRAGAATDTPAVWAITSTVAWLSPCSSRAPTRRSARPISSAAALSTAASIVTPAESAAKRTATPRAIPAVVRKLRILRAPRLLQASDERRRTG